MSDGMRMRPLESSFDVAFVCTGNRARSPFAATLLGDLTHGLAVSTVSFGVLDIGPVPALPEAVWAARMLGVDLTRHRARHLDRDSLESADLVIGFEHFHVATAVVEAGAARKRTFLVTELADLLCRIRPSAAMMATPEALIEVVHAERADTPSSGEPIVDPLGRSKQEFVSVFENISTFLDVIASDLFGVASSGVEP